MNQLLKVLWILAVYSIHQNSCKLSEDVRKHFKYFEKAKTVEEYFPRKYTIMSNTEIIAIKCPEEWEGNFHQKNEPGKKYDLLFKKPNGTVEKYLSIKKNEDRHEWRIYNIRNNLEKKIDCLIAYKINSTSPFTKWNHMINRTSGSKFNIIRGKKLNIALYSHAKKICKPKIPERTIAFDVKSGFREFNSKFPNLYKGDTLISFGADNFTSETVEFQEPICITKVFHPPPTFDIKKDRKIKINTKNKELWLVDAQSFPWNFTIILAYKNSTNQPGFFNYEKINVTYLKDSGSQEFNEIHTTTLEPNESNKRVFTLHVSAILEFKYYCDDCIQDGVTVTQKVVFGSNLNFRNQMLSSVGYVKDKLNFNVNCSIKPNIITELKNMSFNEEKVDIHEFQGKYSKSIGNFKLEKDFVIFKKKNPSGTLRCNYKHRFGEHTTSQKYKFSNDEHRPLITYYYNNLLFKANCSTHKDSFGTLITISYNGETITEVNEVEKNGQSIEEFIFDENFATLMDNNPNGELSCIYKLTYGEVEKKESYKYFKNETSASITYPYGDLPVKPECRMDQVDDLNNATGKTKGNFKMEGKKVIFLGNNPKGKLSCIYKLTHGVYSINKIFKYFKTPTLPPIKYATDQLGFNPNCSQEPEKNVKLKTIMFNDESIEIEDLENASGQKKGSFKLDRGFVSFLPDNPKGKFTCVYTLYKGKTETSQVYELIEERTLDSVRYAHDQLNFNPNCSKKVNDITSLKAIEFNGKTIVVEGLDDAAINRVENLKSDGNLYTFIVKNPEGKFTCIYKVPIGETKIFQEYKSISNETLLVKYPFNRFEYKANCSRHLNSFTHLRGIQFKDDKTTVVSLQRSRVGALGRLKLEKDFVINTEKNPNGTLSCLYDVPVGKIMIEKNFSPFLVDDEENSTSKSEGIISIIFKSLVLINMMIAII
uniref:Ig-like domain-containing protein n=1 Tax=Strongyloides papillosus TaxID=174720 RepID=A0A0N5BBV5_STREA